MIIEQLSMFGPPEPVAEPRRKRAAQCCARDHNGDGGCDRHTAPRFDGNTYNPRHDQKRLGKQLDRVRDLMADGAWRTLGEIEAATGAPQASASARLRDLRKPRFGKWGVERRRRGAAHLGIFEYRLTAPAEVAQ